MITLDVVPYGIRCAIVFFRHLADLAAGVFSMWQLNQCESIMFALFLFKWASVFFFCRASPVFDTIRMTD